jgi:hypothetical protein
MLPVPMMVMSLIVVFFPKRRDRKLMAGFRRDAGLEALT